MKNNHTPEIRFSGFTEDWVQRKLNELVTPVVREVSKPDTPYKRISIRSHAKGTFHQKVDDPKTVSMDKLYVVKENDLIVNITFAWEHAIAIANKEDDGLLVSHRFPTFVIDKSDVNFIQYTVVQEKFRRKMELISPGGAGRNRVLNKNDFVNLKINVPKRIEEQTKIGNFFKQLDKVITLHQQELNTLEQAKQGFMQKMFPKKGEKVPEVRFPGFTEDWKDYRLSDIGSTYTGLSGKTKEDFGVGEGYYIPYRNVFANVIAKEDSSGLEKVDISDGKHQNKVFKGDLLITTSSETPEEVGMVSYWGGNKENVYLNSFCFGYRINIPDIEPLFLAYLLRSSKYRFKITMLAQGSTRFNLSKTELLKLIVEIPSLEEQRKICTFFKQLDDMIVLKERQLAVIKDTKKAFLQKMFV